MCTDFRIFEELNSKESAFLQEMVALLPRLKIPGEGNGKTDLVFILWEIPL